MSETENFFRIRLHFSRGQALRYVSHLDMHLLWERTLRRAGMPLAYTKGFNPNPRLHQAAALPLGFLSRAEITDFWLEISELPDLEQIKSQIQAAAPPGLVIDRIESIPLQAPALQTQVISSSYRAAPLDPMDPDALVEAVADLLEAKTIQRERKGKPYDLRPLIERLVVEAERIAVLEMQLTAREGATGRPEEVILALGLDPAEFRVERTTLILKD